jgi:presenilin-like A22 family membrane protease
MKKLFHVIFRLLLGNSELIVFAEAYFFIAGGFLTIFGFCLSKLLIFLAVLIDLSLIHNVYFYRETKHLILASGYLGIFGGVWSI